MTQRTIAKRIIAVVDDHEEVRASLGLLLQSAGYPTLTYASGEDLLAAGPPEVACIVTDVRMPGGMDGVALVEAVRHAGIMVPILVVSGHGDIPLAVRAMKAGACDFIEKPYTESRMLEAVEAALAMPPPRPASALPPNAEAVARLGVLSPREQEVLHGLVAGKSNKVIAADLDISPRTVEVHRANLKDKLGVRSVAEAIRLALVAGVED